jgi:hypothetical protein
MSGIVTHFFKVSDQCISISVRIRFSFGVPSTKDGNGTIKLAAFNLQIFGTTKASKPEVMGVLSKIIRNYDVTAVQEIRDSSQTALPMLRDAVNSMGSSQYDYIVSERLGRTPFSRSFVFFCIFKFIITQLEKQQRKAVEEAQARIERLKE